MDHVAVVNAYGDRVYNRCSIHLAGHYESVSRVASLVAKNAHDEFRDNQCFSTATLDADTRHPFVGLVDHVSCMPLQGNDGTIPFEEESNANTPSGKAARGIGSQLETMGVKVFYYGNAHTKGTALAVVRKEKTHFFTSGGLQDSPGESRDEEETTIVGAPQQFVENYNIRLRNCSRSTATTLTRHLRERDGGLVGVEALTLPYSDERWEVACNLLSPGVTSSEDVQIRANEWDDNLLTSDSDRLIEYGYRVGTTSQECLSVLRLGGAQVQEHNEKVYNRVALELRCK